MRIFKLNSLCFALALLLNIFPSQSLTAQEEEISELLFDTCIYNNEDEAHSAMVQAISNETQIETTPNLNSKIAKHAATSHARFKYETTNVSIVILGGYKFHVADYLDGSRVVTALDGKMKGYQAVGMNGIQQGYSENVEWRGTSFIHYYPYGRIISYPDRQIVELY